MALKLRWCLGWIIWDTIRLGQIGVLECAGIWPSFSDQSKFLLSTSGSLTYILFSFKLKS